MYAINASKLEVVLFLLRVRGDGENEKKGGETSSPGLWNIIKFTIHVSDRVFAALDRIGMHDPVCGQKDRSHLVISSSFALVSPLPPCPVPCPIPTLYIPPSCSLHLPTPSIPSPNPNPHPLLLHRSPAPAMHHIVTWVGRRHKGNAQQKSVVRCDTSMSQPKGESEKKMDMEATRPCHVDLGSGHVSPLNSTSRSNDEDVSTCNDYAITGRYLLLPRITDRPVSLVHITQIVVPLMLISLSQACIKVTRPLISSCP